MTLIKTTVTNSAGEIGRWFFASEQEAEKAVMALRDTLKANLVCVSDTRTFDDAKVNAYMDPAAVETAAHNN